MDKKRNKGKNYTETEKEILFQIVMKFKNIIENKNTDSATLAKKNSAWMEVQKEYNSQQVTGLREVKNLKTLYENLKMKARKEKHKEKVEQYKTGGGPCSEIIGPLSAKIIGELANQYEPLSNPYDSSASYYNDTEMVLIDELTTFPQEISEAIPDIQEVVKDDNTVIIESVSPQTKVKDIQDEKPQKMRILNKISNMTQQKLESSEEKKKYLEIEHLKRLSILELQHQTMEKKKKVSRDKTGDCGHKKRLR